MPHNRFFYPFIKADQSDFSFQKSWDPRDSKCFCFCLFVTSFNSYLISCVKVISVSHESSKIMSFFPKLSKFSTLEPLFSWQLQQPFYSYLTKWILDLKKKHETPLIQHAACDTLWFSDEVHDNGTFSMQNLSYFCWQA